VGFPPFPRTSQKLESSPQWKWIVSHPVLSPSFSSKATLIIKIEHKCGLFNRFGFNFASVGRHSIKRIFSSPLLLPPFSFGGTVSKGGGNWFECHKGHFWQERTLKWFRASVSLADAQHCWELNRNWTGSHVSSEPGHNLHPSCLVGIFNVLWTSSPHLRNKFSLKVTICSRCQYVTVKIDLAWAWFVSVWSLCLRNRILFAVCIGVLLAGFGVGCLVGVSVTASLLLVLCLSYKLAPGTPLLRVPQHRNCVPCVYHISVASSNVPGRHWKSIFHKWVGSEHLPHDHTIVLRLLTLTTHLSTLLMFLGN